MEVALDQKMLIYEAANFRTANLGLFQLGYDLMFNDNEFYQRLSASGTSDEIRTVSTHIILILLDIEHFTYSDQSRIW